MANAYATNFAVPGSTNVLQVIWKLTRVMKKAGWTTVSHSNGSVKTSAGTNNNDSWGSNADPLTDTYPSFDAVSPWIVMRGPSTLKIPLSAAPTGTPLRGEKITQAVSGAEGELLGHVWDSVGLSGWMVVAPHTGTFDNSHTITGSSSSATLTPTGTIVTYVREVMFAKLSNADNVNGQIYYVCADSSAESASLYSTLAASAGCTATVPPGDGGTGNSFPALGLAVRGTTGGVVTTNSSWFGSSSGYTGNAQMGAANATPTTNVSADGSFYVTISTVTPGQISGFIFTRLDDGEPGDVDPYAWLFPQSSSFGLWSRTTMVGNQGAAFINSNVFHSSQPTWFAYQARGCPVSARDVVVGYGAGVMATAVGGTVYMLNYNSNTVRLLNRPEASGSTPLVREHVEIFGTGTTSVSSLKQYKGKCRWFIALGQGSPLDTYDNKTFLCVTANTVSYPAFAVGPYDGSTTPST